MGPKRGPDEILLHQISLPARRDYQLRSSSPLKTDPSKVSYSQLVARAFQNARALSFNASHDEVPCVLDHVPHQRAFYSGPLTSKATAMTDYTIPPAGPPKCDRSSSSASFATAESTGHSGDLSEASQEQPERAHHGRPGDEKCSSHYQRNASRAETRVPTCDLSASNVRGRGGVGTRSARDGELMRASRTSVGNRSARSGEVVTRARSSTGNRSARSGEIVRAARSGVENAERGSERMVHGKKNAHSGGENHSGAKTGEKGRGGDQSRRRPTASIAWDSLNKSQENSPQHELAAIPFKWEEAPGKPIANSIAAAAERAMAKRFLREVGHEGRTARRAVTESRTLSAEGTTLSSPSASFRSSHRFYARTAPGDRSFGPRKSVDGAHIISEVETNPHIDLVAPAAAKFLVESWVSPGNVTPEPNLTTTIPFQWEAAPGVPKLDEMDTHKPIPLQLPPRLAAPPPPYADTRGRQQTRSMSGPLAGHTSPSRRRQMQHSPPVMRRSCSPSKRSISPSRIQALAKHFSRKPSEEFDRSSNRAIGRSASGMMLSELPKVEPVRSYASGPLDYGGHPKQRYSSPSKRSVSPSRRIHALAKQLTSKIRSANDQSEDPHWPVKAQDHLQRQHSFTRLQPAVTLYRENFDAGEGNSTPSSPKEAEPASPTSILQGPSSGSSVHTPASDVALSKSLSRVSYESFEHSFAERDSGGSSPYLGPTCEERRATVGAAEGVKAIIKMCRSGSTWRRGKAAHSPEMWAPTLASYFQCLEATLSNPVNGAIACDHGSGSGDSSEGQTRLPYTMPAAAAAAHGEQNLAWREYCDSPNAELKTCLGVKLSPARFVMRGNGYGGERVVAWGDRLPTSQVEDGYRSPAYAATLELLSPSAELFRKKKRVVGASRGVKFIVPSPSMRRKTQFVEAMCKSLKRALYKCAKRCCRKTLRSSEEPVLPKTEFSFYKPN